MRGDRTSPPPLTQRAPTIALLASAGLFAALLGDGAWDALAWLGLGLIALLGGWPLLPRWRNRP